MHENTGLGCPDIVSVVVFTFGQPSFNNCQAFSHMRRLLWLFLNTYFVFLSTITRRCFSFRSLEKFMSFPQWISIFSFIYVNSTMKAIFVFTRLQFQPLRLVKNKYYCKFLLWKHRSDFLKFLETLKLIKKMFVFELSQGFKFTRKLMSL